MRACVGEWIEKNKGKHFCKCGCGQDMFEQKISREVFVTWHSRGIPDFVKTHSHRVIYPNERKFVICYQCKKSIIVWKSKFNRQRNFYCNAACMRAYRRSDEGRRKQAYWEGKGCDFPKEGRLKQSETMKKLIKTNAEVIKNLKNVNIENERRCSWGICKNYVYGKANYCHNHYPLTHEGKIHNRATSMLYYVAKKTPITKMPQDFVYLFIEYQKAKEVISGYSQSC